MRTQDGKEGCWKHMALKMSTTTISLQCTSALERSLCLLSTISDLCSQAPFLLHLFCLPPFTKPRYLKLVRFCSEPLSRLACSLSLRPVRRLPSFHRRCSLSHLCHVLSVFDFSSHILRDFKDLGAHSYNRRTVAVVSALFGAHGRNFVNNSTAE